MPSITYISATAISYSGDQLKKIILITLICCSILCFSVLAADSPAKANSGTKQNAEPMSFSAQGAIESSKASTGTTMPSQGQIPNIATSNSMASTEGLTTLKQDSGKDFSKMNMTMYSAVNDFGAAGLNVGEVVKFTAPKPGWKLKKIQIVGLSIFNNTTKRYPADRNFLVEVRDSNADLLYKFADTQNMYFASAAGPVVRGIDIPALPITGDFYIAFYDRGAMLIGAEQDNGTGNSYFVVNGKLDPAQYTTRTNETVKINWLIRALGE